MIKNFFVTAIRNIKRDFLSTLINVTGFTFGITCCILILVFIQNEMSYDNFHVNIDRIYRLNMKFNVGANKFNVDMAPIPLAEELVSEYPEVNASTRLFHKNYRSEFAYVKYGEKQYREEKFFWADSNVFDVFTIPLISGDKDNVLTDLNSVVITREMAVKYFGNENPIGKLLIVEDGILYRVTGIMESMPVNSHIKFDFLASFSTHPKSRDPEWYDFAAYTYILLDENAFPSDLEKKLPNLSEKHYAQIVQQTMGVSYDQFLEAGNYIGFFLEPLRNVHLNSDIAGTSLEPIGDINTVYIFSAIALIILLVACINFINLSTARSGKRATEVGVRKVVGSTRKQLIIQFLSESFLLSGFAVICAILAAIIVLPFFNEILGKNLSIQLLLDTWYFLPGSVGLIILIGVVSGTYPAFLLASFKPISVLRGITPGLAKGFRSRNIMVVFQFITSVVLFIVTIVVYQQQNYIMNKNLGFNKEHLLVIKSAQKLTTSQESFKQRIKQNSNVLGASYSDSAPQMLLEVKIFHKEGSVDDQNHTLIAISADHDFVETYKIDLAKGRYFLKQMTTDDEAIILNSAAINVMGIENTDEERVIQMGRQNAPLNVIGVVQDFHFQTLHVKIQPMAFLLLKNKPGVVLSVRISPIHVEETVAYIQKTWNDFVPGQPIEYVFMDEEYNKLYTAESQSGKVFGVFSLIAIIIACMGLFGIASLTSEQRRKEIGIRKVMGASVARITLLLNIEFIKWVMLANLIAYPIAYFAVNDWLESFEYKVELSLWMFITATVLAILTAVITVSFRTLRAATANPVNALKYE